MGTVVGLDLGAYAVKVVRLEGKGRADFEVIAYDAEALGPAFEPPGPGDDEPVRVPLADRHLAALTALKERGSLEGELFITGLSGSEATVRTLTFPFSDPRKIAETLPFELENEIPFDIDDIVYSWTPVEKVYRPGDAPENKDETEILVAFAKRDAVEGHLELLGQVGIDPRHIEFDALTLDDLYTGVFKDAHEREGPTEGPQLTPGGTVIEQGEGAPLDAVAMVDIGHQKTNVCILGDDGVARAHTILHGGADATRALARELSIDPDEAEVGKRSEAFIEVIGTTAQFPDQRRVSEILKGAMNPVVRRLRQLFQSVLSSSKVRVTKVILTGGGSRIINLDRHLAETLNVRVERGRDIATRLGAALPLPADHEAARNQGEVPEAAFALALALAGLGGDKRARIDFRTGDFAWRGDFDFVRERLSALGVWAAVLFVLVGGVSATKATLYGAEEDKLLEEQIAACKTITGMDIDSPSKCLAIIKERISGQAGFRIPDDSAADMYLEVSRRIPPASVLTRKVTELDVSDERVRIKATTSDFDAVDKIVAGLAEGRCFSEVEKGKARNVKNGVEFNVTIRLDCEAAPGKPLVEPVD